ncbi:hypothetical protein [Mycobacterium sp. RTGN5]|uniref:hypothetical protein n=1 Tax=Mycobacterium sp. RTGN5 TaxID=3016522 RepID=UPI0029C9B248|nr:hypothetical protein [Mycobacterium sp. RTGN5]
MPVSFSAGVAVATAMAIVWAPTTAPPDTPPARAHAVTLAAAALPTTPYDPYDGPSLFDLIGHGVVIPSLGQPPPTAPANTPIPVATGTNDAIKNIYNAVEPWVRYGFEVATYVVGWVPYVGWLSGQIMIFYNFGERIVRSITFNVADWLFGPLPFVQGLRNVARDSWNALVQLGIDEWNYFLPPLPPLPPLPLAAKQAAKQTEADTSAQPTQTKADRTPRATGRPLASRTARIVPPTASVTLTLPAGLGDPTANRRVDSAAPRQSLSQKRAAHEKPSPKSASRPKAG